MSNKALLLTLVSAVANELFPGQKLTTNSVDGTTRLTSADFQASYSSSGTGENVRMVYSGDALRRFSVGVEKPKAMARLAEAIERHLPASWVVSYSDAPQGRNPGYPTFWVNRAQISDGMVAAQVDWAALATEAKAVNMTREEFVVLRADLEALRAEIAVRRAFGAPAETPPVVDNDGDTVAQTTSNTPTGVDDDIPF